MSSVNRTFEQNTTVHKEEKAAIWRAWSCRSWRVDGLQEEHIWESRKGVRDCGDLWRYQDVESFGWHGGKIETTAATRASKERDHGDWRKFWTILCDVGFPHFGKPRLQELYQAHSRKFYLSECLTECKRIESILIIFVIELTIKIMWLF